MTFGERQTMRRAIRRRTLANLMIALVEQSLRSHGRLVVEPWTSEAFVLGFPKVRVLVRRAGGFAYVTTDVRMIVVCPPEWPFVRDEMLRPAVVEPVAWAHPNASAAICIDLAGITPARLAPTLYDVVRLARKRLDHPFDHDVAAFVRAHLSEMPTDPRPLLPCDAATDPAPRPASSPGVAPAPATGGALPGIDLVVGTIRATVPALDVPTFVRLGMPAGGAIDAARQRYLMVARAQLRACVPGWQDGPGVVAGPVSADDPELAAEVVDAARGLALLGELAMARRYLAHGPTTPTEEGGTFNAYVR